MHTRSDRHPNPKEIAPPMKSLRPFESVTQRFLTSQNHNKIQCPVCGTTIDFNKRVIWQGPDTFACCGCERLLNIRLIHRALRDLGIE